MAQNINTLTNLDRSKLGFSSIPGPYNSATGNLIDMGILSGTNQPMIMPQTMPQTESSAFSSFIENLTTASQTESDKLAETSQATANQSGMDYLKGLVDSSSVSSSIDYTDQNRAKKEVDRLTANILAESKANRDRIETVRKTFQGTTAGLADELGRINNESTNKQADLAILKFVADNDYQGAKEIADRSLTNKLEASRIKLDALKYIADNNKEIADRAFTVALNEKILKEQREFDAQKANGDKIKDIKLNVGFSDASNKDEMLKKLGEIDLTKTDALDQALEIAGRFGGDYLKADLLKQQIETEKAQRANIYANINKTKMETSLLNTPGGGKPITEAQAKSAGFAERIRQANDIIDSKADVFKKMSYADFKLAESKSQIANYFMLPDVRQAAQAMRNFITAKLRKESGASIAESEFKDAQLQYFPALGDDGQTLINKKTLRDSVLQNEILGAGSAYTAPSAVPPPNPFSTALGKSSVVIPGTGIIKSVLPDGGLNFQLP